MRAYLDTKRERAMLNLAELVIKVQTEHLQQTRFGAARYISFAAPKRRFCARGAGFAFPEALYFSAPKRSATADAQKNALQPNFATK